MSDNDLQSPQYIPPSDWPPEAWEALLDAYFGTAVDTPDAPSPYRFVLLRVPAELVDRLEQQRGTCLKRVGTGGGLCKRPAGHSGDHDD